MFQKTIAHVDVYVHSTAQYTLIVCVSYVRTVLSINVNLLSPYIAVVQSLQSNSLTQIQNVFKCIYHYNLQPKSLLKKLETLNTCQEIQIQHILVYSNVQREVAGILRCYCFLSVSPYCLTAQAQTHAYNNVWGTLSYLESDLSFPAQRMEILNEFKSQRQ